MTKKSATQDKCCAEMSKQIAQLENTIKKPEQLEKNLRESERCFKDLFNNTPLPLWDTDFTEPMRYFAEKYKESTLAIDAYLDENPRVMLQFTRLTKILNINKYVFELSGAKTKEEFTEGFGAQFMSTCTFDNVRDFIKNLRAGNKRFTMEAMQVGSDGQKRFVKHYCTVTHDYDYAVLIASVDISQQKLHAEHLEMEVQKRTKELNNINQQLAKQILINKKAEAAKRRTEERLSIQRQQLMRVSRASSLGAITSSLAHQLNQPLTIISSYAQACRNKMQSSPNHPLDADYAMGKIVEHAEKAGNIIHQIRNFLTKKNPDKEICNINDAIKDAIELIDYGNLDKTVINFNNKKPLSLYINTVQLEHAMLNIMQNAVDSIQNAKTELPKIEVTIAMSDTYLTISVSDNGHGVPKDMQHNIFELFYTTKSDGMGMGLAICRSIIESYGGRVRLASKPNQDTTFYIDLPMEVLVKK